MSGNLKLLVLDDEPIVGRRLAPALGKLDCTVETFVDPKEVLERINQQDFDIVITDIRMDEVNGIEILEKVLARSPRTRVIMITGYATMEVAREALAKGAFDFIAKPFKPRELLETVVKAARDLGEELTLPPPEQALENQSSG